MRAATFLRDAVCSVLCAGVVFSVPQPLAAGPSPRGSAARNLPHLQEEFLKLQFGMFIHFNMGTFAKREWATGYEDPAIFNPPHLDCAQWACAAASAGMRYAVLTVKHTGGWCLWDSDATDHDIRALKNYKNGKGDIVREFVEAFRARGIKVGFYYCFPLLSRRWQQYWTLPIEGYTTGTCDAVSFIKKQFTELLTRYGEVSVLWVDQAVSTHGGLKPGDWKAIKAYVHSIAPQCIVIANNQTDFALTDVYGYEYPYSKKLPAQGNTNPSEVCDKLQRFWFSCRKGEALPVQSTGYVVRKMLRFLTRNRSNYLLNCAPDDTGRLCGAVCERLKEFGNAWRTERTGGRHK